MSLIAAYINTHQKENNNKQNRFAQLLNATCHQCHFNLPLMGQSSSKVGGKGSFVDLDLDGSLTFAGFGSAFKACSSRSRSESGSDLFDIKKIVCNYEC